METENYTRMEIDEFGNKYYYNSNYDLHRTDGPAIECVDGFKAWWVNGKLHRTDGPAREWEDGTKEWYQNGLLHRIDGPAKEWPDGSKLWYQNDVLHRLDGPAIERANGSKEFYIDGILLTEKEFFNRITVQEFTMDELAERLGLPVELLKIKK